ncbi:Transmembrane protein, partial [Pseudolycoriella hygida]
MTAAIFHPPAEITDYWGYVKSIDWYDPWLICLILGHILLLATAVLTRNHNTFQTILFFCLRKFNTCPCLYRNTLTDEPEPVPSILVVVVYFSENINEIAAANWQKFSKQQYFDVNGLFISTFFSIPVLLICMLMIGNWLYSSTQIIANVKTAQLRQRLRQQKRESADSNNEPNV